MFYRYVCMHTMCVPGAHRSQIWNNGNWGHRQLWDALWILGSKPRSSSNLGNFLNELTSSLIQLFSCMLFKFHEFLQFLSFLGCWYLVLFYCFLNRLQDVISVFQYCLVLLWVTVCGLLWRTLHILWCLSGIFCGFLLGTFDCFLFYVI